MQVVFAVVAALAAASSAGRAPGYRAEIEQWRSKRQASLRDENGWLAVTGLYWLKEGANRFGSGPENDVVLPSSVAARAGVLELRDGKTTITLEPGVTAAVGGRPVAPRHELAPNSEELISLGRVTLQLLRRQDRFGIRVRDSDSKARTAFKGSAWFPVQDAYRFTARWVGYPAPKNIPIVNVLGQVQDMPSPGYVVFTIAGKELRLEPVLEEPGSEELFFLFRDETSGKETYGAGRFLYAPAPKNGSVVLDFNKATTPPCGFTPFATCPLPPRQNRLPVRMEAGEKKPAGH